MQNVDWNIYKYLIAVAESGSALAAADRLGVNGSTVIRRIKRFEEDRAVRLFDRSPTGYSPTTECEKIIKSARMIEQNVAQIERSIAGQDSRLSGNISVTTTDSFLETVLADIIVDFCNVNSSITVDITVTSNRLSLSNQGADVAVRASRNPPEHLTGVRVAEVAFSVYGRARDLGTPPPTSENAFSEFRWIAPGDALSMSPAAAWMKKHVPSDRVRISADTFVAMRSCARFGGGLATLPCILGDHDASLARVCPPVKEMETSLWILTHPQVRKAARVKEFTRHLGHRLRECRDRLEGV